LHRRSRYTKDGIFSVKKPTDVLQLMAEAPPMKARLGRVRKGEAVAFEHVFPSARPTLAALIARAVPGEAVDRLRDDLEPGSAAQRAAALVPGRRFSTRRRRLRQWKERSAIRRM
jgi:hypothetical protein